MITNSVLKSIIEILLITGLGVSSVFANPELKIGDIIFLSDDAGSSSTNASIPIYFNDPEGKVASIQFDLNYFGFDISLDKANITHTLSATNTLYNKSVPGTTSVSSVVEPDHLFCFVFGTPPVAPEDQNTPIDSFRFGDFGIKYFGENSDCVDTAILDNLNAQHAVGFTRELAGGITEICEGATPATFITWDPPGTLRVGDHSAVISYTHSCQSCRLGVCSPFVEVQRDFIEKDITESTITYDTFSVAPDSVKCNVFGSAPVPPSQQDDPIDLTTLGVIKHGGIDGDCSESAILNHLNKQHAVSFTRTLAGGGFQICEGAAPVSSLIWDYPGALVASNPSSVIQYTHSCQLCVQGSCAPFTEVQRDFAEKEVNGCPVGTTKLFDKFACKQEVLDTNRFVVAPSAANSPITSTLFIDIPVKVNDITADSPILLNNIVMSDSKGNEIKDILVSNNRLEGMVRRVIPPGEISGDGNITKIMPPDPSITGPVAYVFSGKYSVTGGYLNVPSGATMVVEAGTVFEFKWGHMRV